MPRTLPSSSPTRTDRSSSPLTRGLGAAALVVVVLAFCTLLTRDLPRVDLSVDNPTDCDVYVGVARPGATSYLDLGEVPAHASADRPATIDIGDDWVFRFRYAGEPLGQADVTRAQLAATGWQYTVPASIATRGGSAGCGVANRLAQ
jgi:hypothetical protein